MKHLYLTVITLVLFFLSGQCQLNYAFSAVTGTYTPLSGGNTPILLNSQLPYALHDEGFANSIPLGFTFNYNGSNYTTISANTNGFASFQALTPIVNPATDDYY